MAEPAHILGIFGYVTKFEATPAATRHQSGRVPSRNPYPEAQRTPRFRSHYPVSPH